MVSCNHGYSVSTFLNNITQRWHYLQTKSPFLLTSDDVIPDMIVSKFPWIEDRINPLSNIQG